MAAERPGPAGDGAPVAADSAQSIWVWQAVGVIVLLAFAAGGIVGFLGGRAYEQGQSHVVPDITWLLGATLRDEGGAVVLRGVQAGGPAEAAGLQNGDRITALDRRVVRSAARARMLLAGYGPGDAVTVEYERGFRTRSAVVVLGEWMPIIDDPVFPPPPDPPLPPIGQQGRTAEGRLGVYYRMLEPGDPFEVDEGALVLTFLDENTPAEAAGLAPGDIILRVGSTRLSASYDLSAALDGTDAGERVTLTVWRGGAEQRVTVRLGG